MCAIAGIIGLKITEEILQRMLESMKRRGPDGNGVYCINDTALLHSRLAIVDPLNGNQPMHLVWAGEKYTLTYNGELYNTSELRSELEKAGHIFVGYSDTEVVLHAYAQWGSGCLEKMNGIFAFAVWEEKNKRLFLARDRIGVKPLFYKIHGTGLLFASEIKTILQYPTVKAALDSQGAMQIIMLGPGRMPGSGIFRDIYEIEPGCCGYYEQGRLKIIRYWMMKDRTHQDSFDDTVDKVRYLVTDAIKRQMVSDMPLGTFLSGGLDSSIITAVCAKEMRERGEVLDTFSVDYQDNDRYFESSKFQPESDNKYITIMESALHTRHHRTILTAEQLVSSLEDATIARDLPGMADVDFSLLAFSGEIRKNVKVALSGECADEIFGGYPWYRDPEIRDKDGFPWAQNTSQRVSLLTKRIHDREKPNAFVMDMYLSTCKHSDILPENSATERRMKEMVNLNFRWFMQTLLDRKDRMSMYHSLEVRVPFCDYRIAEYLYSVPWEFKNWMGREKGLLRKAVAGILPEAVLYRKKSPYPKTFDPNYARLIHSKLDCLIQDQNAPLWHIVDRCAVVDMLKDEGKWPWYGQLMRHPQTMAYLLQINFWLIQYHIDIVI